MYNEKKKKLLFTEDKSMIRICLSKAHNTAAHCWPSLLKGKYEVDPFTFDEMQKKLTLQRFQLEVSLSDVIWFSTARSLLGMVWCLSAKGLSGIVWFLSARGLSDVMWFLSAEGLSYVMWFFSARGLSDIMWFLTVLCENIEAWKMCLYRREVIVFSCRPSKAYICTSALNKMWFNFLLFSMYSITFPRILAWTSAVQLWQEIITVGDPNYLNSNNIVSYFSNFFFFKLFTFFLFCFVQSDYVHL